MQIIKSINPESSDFGQDIKEFQSEILSYAETQGRHNANQNKPNTLEEFKAFIFNHIGIKTNEQLHKNQQHYLPVAGMVVAKKIQTEANQKYSELTGIVNECEHKIIEVEKRKKELTPDLKQRKKNMISKIVVALIGLAEGYLIYEALRRSGFHILAALITSIGLAAGIAFLTHVVAQYIKSATAKRQHIIRTSLVLIPALILFLVLGNIRADAYNSASELKNQTSGLVPTHTSNSSGWKIALVSFFLYCIGLAISVWYAKTKEEKEQERAYDKVCLEFNELQGKINNFKGIIESIENDAKQKVHSALATYEYALSREKQLQSIAHKALETYASNNLRHRTDGKCPIFFSTLPAFSFVTFFDNVKIKNN